MKRGLYIAVALIGGALIAQYLLADPGYVAIRFAGRLIEMSAVTFVLVLVASYFLIRLLIRVVRARTLWRQNQLQRKQERARRSLSRGLLELSEGNWEAAEDTVLRSTRDAESPAAHYLVAARAADLLGAAERRDALLARALESSTDRRAPALIMQAEIQLKHKQLQQAQATLEQLDATGEQNARGLLLLARVFRQTGDWERLQALEPRLRSTRGITKSVADETVTQVYLDRLTAAGVAKDGKLLASAWKQMPKSLMQHPEIVQTYARAAILCNDHAAAEAQLRSLLNKQWNESAILAYGELEGDDALMMLDRAEQWLVKHSEDAALLLSCARLSMRAELYGKARSYLETSIAIKPRLEAYQLLAALMEQLGERDRAITALNDALVYALGRKPNLPKIRARRFGNRRQSERRQS
jgi:HemY protein